MKTNELIENTYMLNSLIEERRDLLKKIYSDRNTSYLKAPEGKLHINVKGKHTYYYRRLLANDKTGSYLSKKEAGLISQLAQKDYDEKIIRWLAKEPELSEDFLFYNPPQKNPSIPDSIEIDTVLDSDEEYIQSWERVKYNGNVAYPFTGEFFTEKGEQVRSKSEILIANTLKAFHIPYRYEYPHKIKGITVYSDFTCLNVRLRREIIFEHFGMIDSANYMERMRMKIELFEKAGLTVGKDYIFTMESMEKPLSIKTIQLMIRKYLL